MKTMSDLEMVDLGDLTFPGNLVFSGRGDGVDARVKAQLDAKDATGESYEIHIPDGTMTFTLSFFLGMFDASILRLGSAAAFRKKYKFTGEPFPDLIKEGIAEALVRGPIRAI